ncbi:MAG: hypothetical protein AB1627_06455 [Chloroflexota bacterium]
MPSLSLFHRRDPWWEVDGPAARHARRKQQLVAGIAFTAALVAVGAAAFAWAVQLGIAGAFGVHAALGIG